jgi:hypothetical protein
MALKLGGQGTRKGLEYLFTDPRFGPNRGVPICGRPRLSISEGSVILRYWQAVLAWL